MTEFAQRIGLDTSEHAFYDVFGLDEVRGGAARAQRACRSTAAAAPARQGPRRGARALPGAPHTSPTFPPLPCPNDSRRSCLPWCRSRWSRCCCCSPSPRRPTRPLRRVRTPRACSNPLRLGARRAALYKPRPPLPAPLPRLCAAADEAAAAAGAKPPQGLYYMKQTIGNACGTIAMLHSFGNSLETVKLGEGARSRGGGAAEPRRAPERQAPPRFTAARRGGRAPVLTASTPPRPPPPQRRAPSSSASSRPPRA
jgi:hypothetical protein